jgi:uncharacterized alpha-E superfamily protein
MLFLQEMIRGCQRFTGFMAGAMSHNDSYRFISLGRNIERADMTTRIMDFGTLLLAEDRSKLTREHESILWINVLKSLSALLMYRKQVRQHIKGKDVLTFLLTNPDFPSSVKHCLHEISHYCIAQLPNSAALVQQLNVLEQQLSDVDMTETTPLQLHKTLDGLQTEFNVLHAKIAETWFLNTLTE